MMQNYEYLFKLLIIILVVQEKAMSTCLCSEGAWHTLHVL